MSTEPPAGESYWTDNDVGLVDCARREPQSSDSASVDLGAIDISVPEGIVMAGPHRQRLRLHYTMMANRPDGSFRGMGDAVDLTLIAAGFLDYSRQVTGPARALASLHLTRKGMAFVARNFLATKARRAPHEMLIDEAMEYVRSLNRLVWKNIEFQPLSGASSTYAVGPKVYTSLHRQATRPDLFSIVSTLDPEKAAPTVHEIKVRREDLLDDIKRHEKRGGYFLIAERVIYVAPEGVAIKSDIPEECGLILKTDRGFQEVKRAKKKPHKIDARTLMNLLVKYQTQRAGE